jgi:tRNA U38,U39,U40 pseudouridine synthase TruA
MDSFDAPVLVDGIGEHDEPMLVPMEGEAEIAVDGGDADDTEETGTAFKKERVAVIFGYVGSRFQGLQRNPGAFAVEDELEGALHRAGGISKSNLGNFQKIGWNRAARTDKGVHAMGQVVSLRMNMPRCSEARDTIDYTGMRDRINSELPSDLRVFDVCKVTGAFNSHPQCSGRRYEYVLPTMVLQVTQPSHHLTNIKVCPAVIFLFASAAAATSSWCQQAPACLASSQEEPSCVLFFA